MARIALFGGSFDPPTLGHIATARNVLNSGLIDQLWFVPAGDDRYDRPVVASSADRRKMLELCISEVFVEDARVRLEPAQLEGRLPGSAAIDLVDFVKARDPGHALFFVIGADNIEKIAQWREAERLTQSVRFLAVPRVGEAIAPQIPPYVTVIEGGEHSNAASSTARERLRRGEAVDELVSPGVRAYIAAQGLYAASPR